MNELELIKKLQTIDDGRFKDLIATYDISEDCFKCRTFNTTSAGAYMCAIIPTCIGKTIHPRVRSYLLWKLDIITEEQHQLNCK